MMHCALGQPFFDHVLGFYIVDGKVWVRHYQVIGCVCVVGMCLARISIHSQLPGVMTHTEYQTQTQTSCTGDNPCVRQPCGGLVGTQMVANAQDKKTEKKVLRAGEDPVTLVEIGPRYSIVSPKHPAPLSSLLPIKLLRPLHSPVVCTALCWTSSACSKAPLAAKRYSRTRTTCRPTRWAVCLVLAVLGLQALESPPSPPGRGEELGKRGEVVGAVV